MSLEFAKLGGNESYPKRDFDGGEDQSYGFNPAYKLQTGNLRGTQGVGYGGVKIDGARNRVTLEANNTRVTLGDTSDSDNITGMALADTASGNNLVTLGRDITSGSATTGLMAYDSQNTKRLLAGAFPDGSVKIKLSQAGYDVATATDDQLIWSSDFNSFKIVGSGTGTFPTINVATGGGWGGDVLTTEISHNLGYVPIALVFIDFGNEYQLTPSTRITTSGTGVNIATYEASADTTRLLVTTSGIIDRTGAGNATLGGWSMKYYLLRETAN